MLRDIMFDEAAFKRHRVKLMAIIGRFFQYGPPGSAWGDWALYMALPLRALGGDSFFSDGVSMVIFDTIALRRKALLDIRFRGVALNLGEEGGARGAR